MKQAIVALLLFAVSFSVFAEINRPHPGHHRPGPGHYRPGPVMRPGPGHHRPGPGHYRPGPVVIRPRPIPRPMPYPTPMSCQVVMTDRYNRVFRRYWGHESRHSVCPSGLRACNYDIQRMGMWGYRCATVRW